MLTFRKFIEKLFNVSYERSDRMCYSGCKYERVQGDNAGDCTLGSREVKHKCPEKEWECPECGYESTGDKCEECEYERPTDE